MPGIQDTSTLADRLRTKQYLGYAAGDAANNLAFAMASMFLLLYYTDVALIDPIIAGNILLGVRFFDAFADIFAGRMVDRTMTRWGKFRPFILFGSAPVLLLSMAAFSLPTLFDKGWATVLVAVLTYAGMGLAYSLVNIPYGSLASAMTQDSDERARLASFRMVGSAVTNIGLSLVVAPQIKQFTGHPAEFQKSLLITTAILFVIGMALYLFLFGTARERVEREVDHVSLRQSLTTLRQNKPLMLLCLTSVLFLSGIYGMQAVQAFYARDVLGNASLLPVLVTLTTGTTLLVAPFIPKLVGRFGKKRLFLFFAVLATVGGFAITAVPPGSLWATVLAFGVMGIGQSGVNTLMWALEADTVEYGEWKTGVRTEGITYAVFSFTRKCGQAIGASMATGVIGVAGYVGGQAVQSSGAIWGIRLASGAVPAVLLLVGVLVFLAYPLNEETFTRITAENRARLHHADRDDSDHRAAKGENPYATSDSGNRPRGTDAG